MSLSVHLLRSGGVLWGLFVIEFMLSVLFFVQIYFWMLCQFVYFG